MNKKVFVIIVTYNGAYWIDKNIQSLLASSYPVNIIAIDNNSSDDSVALLEKYPLIHLVKSPENLGFGKANNIGMKKAMEQGADYLFLLNQDAWIFPDTINHLISIMEANSDLGILSPMHYQANETDLDTSFAIYLGRKSSERENVALVPFVNAAAWMMSSKCVETVGYFEPLFGHYGEDRNYCDRVLYHKFLIGIAPVAKIVHDRIIMRNLKKDLTQSQYKILATLIDPNHSLFSAYIQGLKEAFGLPKYFSRFYSTGETKQMLGKLLKYYTGFIVKPGQVIAARKRAL